MNRRKTCWLRYIDTLRPALTCCGLNGIRRLDCDLDGESSADNKGSLKSDSFDQAGVDNGGAGQAGVDGDGTEPAGVDEPPEAHNTNRSPAG